MKLGSIEGTLSVFLDRLKKVETENIELEKRLEEKIKILPNTKGSISVELFTALCDRVTNVEDLLHSILSDMDAKGNLPSTIKFTKELEDT